MAEFDEYESLPTSSASVHMIAGSLAGVFEHVSMYPVDSVKTRLQSLVREPHATRGLFSTGLLMIRQEGLGRPFRGVWTMVAGAGPAHALYFASYERLKVLLNPAGSSANHNPWAQSAAGAVATVLHDGVMTPAEVVKQRLQMYRSPYRSMWDCIGSVYRTEGLAAFYRSYGTQILMNIPFQCAHFVAYEAMQNLTNPDRTYNPLCHVVSGGVSGAFAAALTTPLDVCKTLLNTQEAGALERTQQTQIRGLANAFRMVYRLGGIRGFSQGMAARVVYQAPSTAICWSVYEFFKYILSDPATRSPVPSADVAIAYDRIERPAANTGPGHVIEDIIPAGHAA